MISLDFLLGILSSMTYKEDLSQKLYDTDRLRGISSRNGASRTFKEELYHRIVVVVIFTDGPSKRNLLEI